MYGPSFIRISCRQEVEAAIGKMKFSWSLRCGANMLKAAGEDGTKWMTEGPSQRIGVEFGWLLFTRGREMHWNVAYRGMQLVEHAMKILRVI